MKTIQKTISLEKITSRLPSVWPAYKDDTLYYFDKGSLINRENEYPSNYGMIPLSIAFSGKTFDKVVANNFTLYEYAEHSEPFVISFETLSKWYAFFNDYYMLLEGYCHCKTYSSATEYYKFESVSQYADKMLYGQDEQTYVELDALFEDRGGQKFYVWICKNVIPTFVIDKEYRDYWKCSKLYYPDVVKWLGWFKDRAEYNEYSGTSTACSESIDYCECNEYFKRGGQGMYDKMDDWLVKCQSNISDNNSKIQENLKFYQPKINDKIELHNSLDDLGEYSIFCTEYEARKDYRTIKTELNDDNDKTIIHYESGNTHGGSVVAYDGESMILKDGKSGFKFNETYMESEFDPEAWSNYTTDYISGNTNEFVSSSYTYYAFDENNKMYTGTTSDEVKNSMSAITVCPIISADSIVIDDTMYPIEQNEYGKYDLDGKKHFVYRESETSTPYTMINGNKKYAELYPNEIDGEPFCYYFTFFKNEEFNANLKCNQTIDDAFNINKYKHFYKEKSNDLISYITYNGKIYEVTESGCTINGINYIRTCGYAYNDFNGIMYISATTNDTKNAVVKGVNGNYYQYEGSTVVNDKVYLGITYDPIIYKADEITGYTSSKLKSLEITNCLTDDVGNPIEGIYKIDGIPEHRVLNHQPPQGTELEPLYQVGNTSYIKRYTEDANQNLFVGNIIKEMVFYYKDVNGEKVNDTCVTATTSSKDAISSATSKMISEVTIFDTSGVYCDITYYIGATLARESDTTNYIIPDGYSYGVEYNETVKFVKTATEYYLKKESNKQIPTKKNSVSAHSISYPIYIWKLEQEETQINDDTHDTVYTDSLAKFKTLINLIDDDLTSTYSKFKDLSDYNGISVYPMFRQEYLLGSATMENIESDIYIERGINAAFEKHLKLGEITSLEMLEKYGNSFFKIMDK